MPGGNFYYNRKWGEWILGNNPHFWVFNLCEPISVRNCSASRNRNPALGLKQVRLLFLQKQDVFACWGSIVVLKMTTLWGLVSILSLGASWTGKGWCVSKHQFCIQGRSKDEEYLLPVCVSILKRKTKAIPQALPEDLHKVLIGQHQVSWPL